MMKSGYPALTGILLLSLWLLPVPAGAAVAGGYELSPQERTYLESVYIDTWNYLGSFVEPLTGLPLDSSARQPVTSLTNIGLYLASTSVAYRTGLISAVDAQKRVLDCLRSLEQIETWHGIPRPWVLVRTLKPTFGDEFTYGPHLSALIGGLLVTQSTFPEASFPQIGPLIDRILQRMELKNLYDASTGWLKGGYDVKKKSFAVFQAWGHWYYKYFASETRLLSFYLIARGLVPRDHWFKLIRPKTGENDSEYFVSGMEDGGLYVPMLTSLFLDERKSEMGRSEVNQIREQIKHAEEIGAPVWGWSSSMTPQGRYLGYGELRDDIVAPYASMLAAIYMPRESVKNLQALERLGARPGTGPSMDYVPMGFRDSVRWESGDIARHYLTPNQAMGFLAIANVLFDGIVWESFAEAPTIERKLKVLGKELEIQPGIDYSLSEPLPASNSPDSMSL